MNKHPVMLVDKNIMSERYIYVLGRTDRIVKIQGVRISLNHV